MSNESVEPILKMLRKIYRLMWMAPLMAAGVVAVAITLGNNRQRTIEEKVDGLIKVDGYLLDLYDQKNPEAATIKKAKEVYDVIAGRKSNRN